MQQSGLAVEKELHGDVERGGEGEVEACGSRWREKKEEERKGKGGGCRVAVTCPNCN
jgi:hypothetical protein